MSSLVASRQAIHLKKETVCEQFLSKVKILDLSDKEIMDICGITAKRLERMQVGVITHVRAEAIRETNKKLNDYFFGIKGYKYKVCTKEHLEKAIDSFIYKKN